MATPDPRDQDPSVMPEPSWSFVILLTIGWTLCRPVIWVADRVERWLVRRGYPT